ncbi:MAG: GNAT family N-acetyltransferase [Azoarcus sp.]|jgi:hypothetical protein|nr:GNAT family N-acetyltransferase [Azoarcus sp.]
MRADPTASAAAKPPSAQDPHLSEEWFDLLRRSAVPEDAVLEFAPIGPEDAPEAARLPLMRTPANSPLITALSTFYTPLFAPIGVERTSEAALIRCFCDLRQRPGVAELRLAPLDPNSPFFAAARHALTNSGWLTDSYFCFGNWYVDLDGSGFTSYWAQRPSKLHHTAERARRKLKTMPGFAIDVIEGGPGLEAAIAAFVSVYGHSWKEPEPWPRFISELCQLAATRGWLRLGVLRLGEQAIASQLWLVSGDCAYIVKLSYDHAYAALSAGTALSAHMMAYVIDRDRVRRVDYLIGDDAYKRDWTPLRRERWGLVAFNPANVYGFASAAGHFAGRALKNLYGKFS